MYALYSVGSGEPSKALEWESDMITLYFRKMTGSRVKAELERRGDQLIGGHFSGPGEG